MQSRRKSIAGESLKKKKHDSDDDDDDIPKMSTKPSSNSIMDTLKSKLPANDGASTNRTFVS